MGYAATVQKKSNESHQLLPPAAGASNLQAVFYDLVSFVVSLFCFFFILVLRYCFYRMIGVAEASHHRYMSHQRTARLQENFCRHYA